LSSRGCQRLPWALDAALLRHRRGVWKIQRNGPPQGPCSLGAAAAAAALTKHQVAATAPTVLQNAAAV